MLKLDIRDITPQLEPTKKCVGLDVGLKDLDADSNGNTVEPPKYYRKVLSKIRKTP